MEKEETKKLLYELRMFGENVRTEGSDGRVVLGGIDLWLAKFCKKMEIDYQSYYEVFRPAYASKLKRINNCENENINEVYFGND